MTVYYSPDLIKSSHIVAVLFLSSHLITKFLFPPPFFLQPPACLQSLQEAFPVGWTKIWLFDAVFFDSIPS